MSGIVTEYIGTDYPVMGYGCSESLSGSVASKTRLQAELAQLLSIRNDFLTVWNGLVDEYAATVIDAIPIPPSGSKESYVIKTKFGGFQVGVVTTDEFEVPTWYHYAPEDWVILSTDGPEPKPMVSPPWLIATGDTSELAGACLIVNHKFGNPAILYIDAENTGYNSEWDETLMPYTAEGTINGTLRNLTFAYESGSPDPGSDLIAYCYEMRFIDEHIYGMPSKQGIHGVNQKIKSITLGNEVMTNNVGKCNLVNDFYRGDNLLETNYTTWYMYVAASATSIKYINVSGSEWTQINGTELDAFKLAVYGDLESVNPSGTKFLLDMTLGPSAGHRYVIVKDAVYHEPSFANYCEIILSPDVMSTVNFKEVSASNDFGDLIMNSDVLSMQVSGGINYPTLIYKNQLTLWVASVSASKLPEALTVNPLAPFIPIIVTHESGLENYFQIYKATDGIDIFAGYTIFEFENGLPIEYQINVINKEI